MVGSTGLSWSASSWQKRQYKARDKRCEPAGAAAGIN
jgi:hypothetical protein